MQGDLKPPAAPSHVPTSEAIERFAQAVARLEVDGTWLVEALTQHMRSMQPSDPSLSADGVALTEVRAEYLAGTDDATIDDD
jgi:hypothetical protein